MQHAVPRHDGASDHRVESAAEQAAPHLPAHGAALCEHFGDQSTGSNDSHCGRRLHWDQFHAPPIRFGHGRCALPGHMDFRVPSPAERPHQQVHIRNRINEICRIVLRYCAVGGILWVLFLIRHRYFMGVRFSENQRTNTMFKTHVEKRTDYRVFKVYWVLHTQ